MPTPLHPATIELASTRLRPLRPDDADALFEYLRDPVVTERTSYPEVTRALAELVIAKSTRRWADGELAKWAVTRRDDDRLIGVCGFNEHAAAHRWAEVAYELAPAYWGRGWMHEAAAAVIDWGFANAGLDRVQAFVRVDNVRSVALLERMGFVKEGRLRSFRVCRGQAFDFEVYAVLRGEWVGAPRTWASSSRS